MLFETERLLIRPINIEDKHDVYAYRSDTETNKYQGWIPKSVKDVEDFIDKISKTINEPESWFQFVIIEKSSQSIIGDIGIHFIGFENQQVEIGCTLKKALQNNGYATESVRVILDYLFTNLKKHRIITSIDPDNQNSIKLVERLGFRKEAHFIQSLWLNGKWVDDLIYAMIEQDWLNAIK